MLPGHLTGEVCPGADPGHVGVVISLLWLENASVSPRKTYRRCPRRGKSGHLSPCDPNPGKGQKIER